MSIDHNKALARRFIQVWMPGNLGLVDELATSDITVTYPVLGGPLRGVEAFKQVIAHFYESLPDLEFSVPEEIAQEDKVAIRWRATATHRGELLGTPPTGKSLTWTGITIYRFTGGRVAEERGEGDAFGVMRQLGVIPAPAQAAALA